jgi:hypothetical protein
MNMRQKLFKDENGENLSGSITVTMTIVLFLIIAVLMVTLEHAYVNAGRTLALETFDKALESTLGDYYAPLYAQYGLLAVSLSENNTYEGTEDIAEAVENMLNYAIGSDSSSGLWSMNVNSCTFDSGASLTTDGGEAFINQLKGQTMYDAALYLTEELSDLKGEDFSTVKNWLGESKNVVETGNLSNQDESSESEDGDGDLEENELFTSLKNILEGNLYEWWFVDADDISKNNLVFDSLPSRDNNYFYSECLFEELSIDDEALKSGEYLTNLVNESFYQLFEDLLDAKDYVSDKSYMIAYAGLNMDCYVSNNVDGKLMYEQEYMIFGSLSDKQNIKSMAWSIFGIRLLADLLYFMTDTDVQNELKSLVGEYVEIEWLAATILILATVVISIENAIVETAAILLGKNVDFAVNKNSQSIQVAEILSFNKEMVNIKAKKYIGVTTAKFGYQVYLHVFMMMISKELLMYRMMDIIQVNICKNYDENFRISNCMVGYSASAKISIPARFVNLGIFSESIKSSSYSYTLQSTVYMPGGW